MFKQKIIIVIANKNLISFRKSISSKKNFLMGKNRNKNTKKNKIKQFSHTKFL